MRFDSYVDKVSIVTGGGSGIGEKISKSMAENGAHIVVFDINFESAARVADLLEKEYNIRSLAIKGDISIEEDVIHMVDRTISKFGQIDILVNNAGISEPPIPTISQDIDGWQRVIDVDLKGSYLCSKFVGERMIREKYGKILMVSSVAGIIGLPQKNSYSSAKAGIIMLTKTLASEWAQYGINVNAIAPGFILTPFLEKGIENGSFKENEIRGITPLGVLGQTKDVANAALFLCSDAAKFITGITVPVDGGLSACGKMVYTQKMRIREEK